LAELKRGIALRLGSGGFLAGYKLLFEQLGEMPGFDCLHYGALRGRDDCKQHRQGAVIGRNELKVRDLEDLALAIFGDEAEPIQILPPGAHGGTRYLTEQRRYRMADGTAGPAAAVSVHPDPRAQALLEQTRECQIGQAACRLRLVWVDEQGQKTVFLITNLPVDLGVAELVTWAGFVGGRDEEACHRWGGVWLISPSEQSRVAPTCGRRPRLRSGVGKTRRSRGRRMRAQTPL